MSSRFSTRAQLAPRPNLAERIRSAIASDPHVQPGPHPVGVEFRSGQVILTGWVPRPRDKVRAEVLAGDLDGTPSVQSDLRAGPPNPRPDAEIATHVEDRLEEDRWINSALIQVEATDGVVFLHRTIDSTLHWRLARAIP